MYVRRLWHGSHSIEGGVVIVIGTGGTLTKLERYFPLNDMDLVKQWIETILMLKKWFDAEHSISRAI